MPPATFRGGLNSAVGVLQRVEVPSDQCNHHTE